VPEGLWRAIVPLTLLLLWEAGSSWGWWQSFVLPSPITVAEEFKTLVWNGQLPSNLLVSLRRVVIGAAFGITAGTALGTVSGLWRTGERALDATLQMMRTLPYLVLVPVFILWFGIYETPKLVIIGIGTSLPMYLNTFSGVRSVDPRLTEMGSQFGLRRWQLIRSVILPGATPSMLVGLRYALGFAWLSLVVAEQINAQQGLGALISNATTNFQTSELMVVVVVYAMLGLSTDLAVRFLERRVMVWRGKATSW
jgi:sulfonate transport system permease protein